MDLSRLPKFKYHPDLYKTQTVVFNESVCNCCGRRTEAYIELMYTAEEIDCICLNCVADGTAAAKFDGVFVQDADPIDNPEAVDELFRRTPGYISWQGENWKACCNDYCAFVGEVGEKDLRDPAFQEKLKSGEIICDARLTVQQIIEGAAFIQGYLFRCLRCDRVYMRIDME